IFLMICLYAYIFYLYKSQRSGEVDYEKYSRLALDDNLGDNLVEERKSKKKGC
ncbi:MAG: cytochrome c oxidase, cbb3-type, CcoQ subunit, partial [Helicobacter sp.]|nr:cytochrome c oxidase, cbb3-type, CcoQ subunit [Helicobacter sp.]